MGRLGYERYGVQGGDGARSSAREMGRVDPEHVVGVHVNVLVTIPSAAQISPDWRLHRAERQRLARFKHFRTT